MEFKYNILVVIKTTKRYFMLKKVSFILIFAVMFGMFAAISVSALDTADVERIIMEVGRELGLNLVITDRSRTWDQQVDVMARMDINSARQMYGYSDRLWDALVGFREGTVSRQSFISTMQLYRSRFTHVGGNAVDIGINRSGLTSANVTAVINALQRRGLSVLDERPMGINALHVYTR